jgi:hypothetical protein
MTDLSLTAASNSPAGTDAIGNNLDDYLRALASILRSTNAPASASIASAATCNIGAADAEVVTITGTTGITSFGTVASGIRRVLRFSDVVTITHNGSTLILPGAANITTAANDVLVFRSLGSGAWTLECGWGRLGLITSSSLTMNTSRVLGRTTASAGAVEEITVGSPLTLSSGALDFDETATLGNNARVAVAKNSAAATGTRRKLNFIEGVTRLSLADDAGNEEVEITIGGSVQTVADAATLTPNADSDAQAQVTALAQALTIAAPTGTPVNGQKMLIRLKDNGTARALTWNAIYRVIGVTLPTTTVISKTHYVGCVYNSADTKWDVLAVGAEA